MCKAPTKQDHAPTSLEVKEKNDESINVVANDKKEFKLLPTGEPHAARRKQILAVHPEIKLLNGPDIRTFYCTFSTCMGMLFLAKKCAEYHDNGTISTFTYVALAYVLGGTGSHSLTLATHEISHNLAFETHIYNDYLNIFLDVAKMVPAAASFKKYHMDHHVYQGDIELDADLPGPFEIKYFNTGLTKFIWVCLAGVMYAIRPLFCSPRAIIKMEVVNMAYIFCCWILFVTQFGIKMPIFLIISMLMGHGLHPISAHFIAEHYQFNPGQETYSYYGPMNYLTYYVGYHNEHHDFPTISCFRLKEVRAIAPEFYDERYITHEGRPMIYFDSWLKVLYNYVILEHIGPHSRCVRISERTRRSMERAKQALLRKMKKNV